MKKGIKRILMGFVLMLILAGVAQAANVVLSWNPVDFAVCDSDLSRSGYRLYESADNGATKKILGETPTGITEFSFQRDSIVGACFYATAFNQFGESVFSEPYCVKTPDVPSALKVLIQELISALEKFRLQL